jgi:hypothetical protein
MTIQKTGCRGREAAEVVEQRRRSHHCDDRKQVRPGCIPCRESIPLKPHPQVDPTTGSQASLSSFSLIANKIVLVSYVKALTPN